MGIISSIFFGQKQKDEDRMRRAAQGKSIIGNVLGSSPYAREWSRQKRHILEKYELREISLRKQWRREDIEIARDLGKMQGKYQRKMDPEKAEKFYGKYERREMSSLQRERDRTLLDMEQEKNDEIRSIQKNIKQWGQTE